MILADAPIAAFEEIDSTSAEAVRRAGAGETGPVWIWAARQTAGRGRRGRAWSSPLGNLYATYLDQTRLPAPELALLGFAAALAVADTFALIAPSAPIRLKWPNDVLLDGRKAAGVLLESGASAPGRLWFALGIGLNLASAPDRADYPTASISEFAPPPAPRDALRLLAQCLAARGRALESDGFAAIRADWLLRAHQPGEALHVRIGAETLSGGFADLTPRGELALDLPNGEQRLIAAADIVFPEFAR